MNSVLELFQNADLTSVGQRLLTLIDTADPYLIALVLAVFTLLGAKMAAPYPALRSWGLRLAVATFLIYLGYAWFSQGTLTNEQLLPTAVRGLVAAGTVLAPLWLVLPVLFFVYSRLRLMLAAFLIYFGYAWLSVGTLDAEQVPEIGLRSALAAGLALIVAWILQPVTDLVTAHLLPRRKPGTALAPIREESAETDRSTKMLEQVRHMMELRQVQQESGNEAERQRRRQRARLKAELCYALHEPTIGMVFPRAIFEEFLNRYLGEQQDPESVEQNATELESMILQYVNSNTSPVVVQPVNLLDLTQWLLEEQQRIHELEADQEQRKTKLAGLTRRYTQLAERILEEEPAK